MEQQRPVATVCRVLGAHRSTVYARRGRSGRPPRPGPATMISDDELVVLIRRVRAGSLFAGEGYRKVRARLGREHDVRVSGKRVLRLLRREGLLAPQRVRGRRKPRPTTARSSRRHPPGAGAPTPRWPGPAPTAGVGVHGGGPRHRRGVDPCGQGRRPVRRLQPVYDAVVDRWGRLDAGIARGLQLRHDWGRNTARPTSWARLAGWASPTTPPSWASRRPTAAPSAGSAPSKSSACGPSCTTPSTSYAKPSAASLTATTPRG